MTCAGCSKRREIIGRVVGKTASTLAEKIKTIHAKAKGDASNS